MHFILIGAYRKAVRWRWGAISPRTQGEPSAAPKENSSGTDAGRGQSLLAPLEHDARVTIEVREARWDDDVVLARIDRLTWSTLSSIASPAPQGSPFFSASVQPTSVLVATYDGAPVGFVVLGNSIPLPAHEHVIELRGLAVDPSYQRRGIGQQLLLAGIDIASRRGARKLTLRVLMPNAAARCLYETCGFVAEGVLREEFRIDGRFVDDVLMARHLQPGP